MRVMNATGVMVHGDVSPKRASRLRPGHPSATAHPMVVRRFVGDRALRPPASSTFSHPPMTDQTGLSVCARLALPLSRPRPLSVSAARIPLPLATGVVVVAAILWALGPVASLAAQPGQGPAVTAGEWQSLKRIQKPEAIPARQGRQALYKRSKNGQVVLASNVALRPGAGNRPLLTPQILTAGSRVLRPPVGIPGGTSPMNAGATTGDVALLWGLAPEVLVRPARRVVLCGSGFAQRVDVHVALDATGGFAQTFPNLATQRSGDDVGCTDGVVIDVPSQAPAGRYWVTVRNPQAAWSSPAPLTIRAAFPTAPYLVGVLEHLEFPKDYDNISFGESGNEQGELRFDLVTGTVAATDAEPVLQRMTFGDATSGFEIRDATRLDPRELQVPFFTSRTDRMKDDLVLSFFGRELDGPATKGTTLQILGTIAGGAVGLYYGGPSGALEGMKLGSAGGAMLDEAVKSDGDQLLGSHTQAFSREDDFGLNVPSFPTSYAFDNNGLSTDGQNIRLAYKMHAVDAPRVKSVRVTIDSIDASALGMPAGTWTTTDLGVSTRAFSAPSGINYPSTRRLPVSLTSGTPSARRLSSDDRVVYRNDQPNDLTYLYFETTLWHTYKERFPAMGQGIRRTSMVARPLTVLLFPRDLLRESELSTTIKHKSVVELATGRGKMPGKFTVYYTIAVER